GFDSNGLKAGVAPDASIVSLKVLDANGNGTIGSIISALDWVVANKSAYHIRVINLSVGASIKESYWTDPLTLAAKRVVDAGVVSLADPASTFYATKAGFLLAGQVSTPFLPYLSLSGTSMASPVVAGTVALMLQANPSLTPNAVKAILQYTSQSYAGYDVLTQGAGFLNALGAVRLARFYATAQPGDTVPVQAMWSKHIVWGNHMLSGGLPLPGANAYHSGVVWGAAQSDTGDNIVWGSGCGNSDCDNIVWG